jgi:hypothetical protein
MTLEPSHALIFSGTAIFMCAHMTIMTPTFVQSLSQIHHLRHILILFREFGILLLVVGICTNLWR